MLTTLGHNFRYLVKQSPPRLFLKAHVDCHKYINKTFMKGAYEGDGQTTMSSLNETQGLKILLNSYSTMGFRLSNNMFVIGSIAVFPRSLFQWNVQSVNDITEEAITLFLKLEPKLDILVIGYGENDKKRPMHLYKLCSQHRIGLEVLPTDKACATFNFLNSESRCVAAGIIPPAYVPVAGDEYSGPAVKRQYMLQEDWGQSATSDLPGGEFRLLNDPGLKKFFGAEKAKNKKIDKEEK
ncbi:hypothetical protein BIW11_06337 [Tropilaelaps mercedesae]|uniref:NADH dehydrogenase [ubiquinone] 1 alpha subcomplex assembly factor 3 n=1 Tax=Tropilaelaps mercedesae TaxID=418985 RepID=A0A1V9XYI0_9ACAR|nr:hypothetical protein BIW11_06337 [Tropilaelaps mercedesae]